MTLWEKISEAQSRKIAKITLIEDGHEVQINLSPNGWYEDFVSFT